MRFRTLQGKLVSVIAVTALCLTCAHADLRVQVEESVNGMEPAPVTHWFGTQRTMRDDGSRYIITNLRSHQSMIVNRETQTYQVIPLSLRPETQIPKVTVQRTDDTRMIGDWLARRYHLSGPATRELSIDIWVTEDAHVDIDAFRRLMIDLGDRPGSEWLKAYEVIDGFPVLQQVALSRPGIQLKSESRVISVKDVAPDQANIYQPPDYYRQLP